MPECIYLFIYNYLMDSLAELPVGQSVVVMETAPLNRELKGHARRCCGPM
jgi:hypothetical protein